MSRSEGTPYPRKVRANRAPIGIHRRARGLAILLASAKRRERELGASPKPIEKSDSLGKYLKRLRTQIIADRLTGASNAEATSPSNLGWFRSTARSEIASPPQATMTAKSTRPLRDCARSGDVSSEPSPGIDRR